MGKLAREEVNRKLLHVLALVLPIGIFYGPFILDIARVRISQLLFCLLLLSFLLEVVRLRKLKFNQWFLEKFGSMMRSEERTRLTGATYIMAGSFICSLLSLQSEALAASAFLSLSLFIVGDAAAALTGKAFGRIKIGDKSLEGALGCLLLCLLLSFGVFPYLSHFTDNWNGSFGWSQILLFSLAITILELFPIKGKGFVLNDNLYVPTFVSLLVFID